MQNSCSGWATPLLPWFLQSVPPGPLWLAVAAMGLCSGVGHLILLQAYTYATPSVISPFLYSQIGFAMVVGWLLFGQVPDGQSLLLAQQAEGKTEERQLQIILAAVLAGLVLILVVAVLRKRR